MPIVLRDNKEQRRVHHAVIHRPRFRYSNQYAGMGYAHQNAEKESVEAKQANKEVTNNIYYVKQSAKIAGTGIKKLAVQRIRAHQAAKKAQKTAKKSMKATGNLAKRIGKAVVKAVKAMISGLMKLGAAIGSGGGAAVVVILLLCMVLLLLFGAYSSLSDTEQSEIGSYELLIGSTVGDENIVAVARSQIGNKGGEKYWSWYGFNKRIPWCACFVSWCADQCGYIASGTIPKFAGVDGCVRWFKAKSQWLSGSEIPQPGMLIFFDWLKGGQDHDPDHVGIVEKVENGYVYTIEGNYDDRCVENRYAIGAAVIYGYAVPAYDTSNDS